MTVRFRRHKSLRLRVSEAELCRWLSDAPIGGVLEYHRGFLALDVNIEASRLPENDRAELSRVASAAMNAMAAAHAHLIQRRHGPDDYSYLIVAREQPGHVRGRQHHASVRGPIGGPR